MASPQPGILAPIPDHVCYLSLDRRGDAEPGTVRTLLGCLSDKVDGETTILGLGAPLLQWLQVDVPGLKPFPAMMASGIQVPSTQHDLWLVLREGDQGELFHRAAELIALLQDGFDVALRVDGFRYQEGRDLTGYEDGTENPQGEAALAAAISAAPARGLSGSSFVAVQQWQHDFDAFHRLNRQQQDHIIGRRRSDNEELDDAPESAHVKRTAQEDFEPEAFMVRRSMPWREGTRGGLHFVAYGHSLYAFEAQMQRMIGIDDGIVDGLFRISRPITGEYYWCPPVHQGVVDLSLLELHLPFE